MDRVISLLAALVGLIALAGAVVVGMRAEDAAKRMAAELVAMRTAIGRLAAEVAAPAPDGFAEGLLALQGRIAALETAARAAPPPAASRPVATDGAEPSAVPAAAGIEAVSSAGPANDCIPRDIRFMAETGNAYPICGSDQVVKVTDILTDSVMIEGSGPVLAGGFGKLGFSSCSVMVFSVDPAGFAEMRVSCTN